MKVQSTILQSKYQIKQLIFIKPTDQPRSHQINSMQYLSNINYQMSQSQSTYQKHHQRHGVAAATRDHCGPTNIGRRNTVLAHQMCAPNTVLSVQRSPTFQKPFSNGFLNGSASGTPRNNNLLQQQQITNRSSRGQGLGSFSNKTNNHKPTRSSQNLFNSQSKPSTLSTTSSNSQRPAATSGIHTEQPLTSPSIYLSVLQKKDRAPTLLQVHQKEQTRQMLRHVPEKCPDAQPQNQGSFSARVQDASRKGCIDITSPMACFTLKTGSRNPQARFEFPNQNTVSLNGEQLLLTQPSTQGVSGQHLDNKYDQSIEGSQQPSIEPISRRKCKGQGNQLLKKQQRLSVYQNDIKHAAKAGCAYGNVGEQVQQYGSEAIQRDTGVGVRNLSNLQISITEPVGSSKHQQLKQAPEKGNQEKLQKEQQKNNATNGNCPSSSMSSSSSCGSIEREADNQENLDELTLEEQAMTHGLAYTSETASQNVQPEIAQYSHEQYVSQRGKPVVVDNLYGQDNFMIAKSAKESRKMERLGSDGSKKGSGLFIASVARSRQSDEDQLSGCKRNQFQQNSQLSSCQMKLALSKATARATGTFEEVIIQKQKSSITTGCKTFQTSAEHNSRKSVDRECVTTDVFEDNDGLTLGSSQQQLDQQLQRDLPKLPLQLQKALRLNLRTFRPEDQLESGRLIQHLLQNTDPRRQVSGGRQSAQTQQAIDDHKQLFLASKSNQSSTPRKTSSIDAAAAQECQTMTEEEQQVPKLSTIEYFEEQQRQQIMASLRDGQIDMNNGQMECKIGERGSDKQREHNLVKMTELASPPPQTEEQVVYGDLSKSTDMTKFRVLTDSQLCEGLLEKIKVESAAKINSKGTSNSSQQPHSSESKHTSPYRNVTQLHQEIEILINNEEPEAEACHEEQEKMILQTLNCSELKLSSLSITATSLNKQTIIASGQNDVVCGDNTIGNGAKVIERVDSIVQKPDTQASQSQLATSQVRQSHARPSNFDGIGTCCSLSESVDQLTSIITLSQTEGALMQQPGDNEAPPQIHVSAPLGIVKAKTGKQVKNNHSQSSMFSTHQILLTDDLMTQSEGEEAAAGAAKDCVQESIELNDGNCLDNISLNELLLEVKSKQNDQSSQKLDETSSYTTNMKMMEVNRAKQMKENSILQLAAPLSSLNQQDCYDKFIRTRSKLNSSQYSETSNVRNPFGFHNEANEMIVISDCKSKENLMNKSQKQSDLQMYHAQIIKKLDEESDTPSLSQFLSASHGFNLKYLAGGKSTSQVNESYFGGESQKNNQSKQYGVGNSILYGIGSSKQGHNNYQKFAETFLQRSTDKTKEKKDQSSSIFDSVPSIDLNISKEELQVLLKRQLNHMVNSREEIFVSAQSKAQGSQGEAKGAESLKRQQAAKQADAAQNANENQQEWSDFDEDINEYDDMAEDVQCSQGGNFYDDANTSCDNGIPAPTEKLYQHKLSMVNPTQKENIYGSFSTAAKIAQNQRHQSSRRVPSTCSFSGANTARQHNESATMPQTSARGRKEYCSYGSNQAGFRSGRAHQFGDDHDSEDQNSSALKVRMRMYSASRPASAFQTYESCGQSQYNQQDEEEVCSEQEEEQYIEEEKVINASSPKFYKYMQKKMPLRSQKL